MKRWYFIVGLLTSLVFICSLAGAAAKEPSPCPCPGSSGEPDRRSVDCCASTTTFVRVPPPPDGGTHDTIQKGCAATGTTGGSPIAIALIVLGLAGIRSFKPIQE